jgi:galactokinase/mevalonate kinase-like predicted kinase
MSGAGGFMMFMTAPEARLRRVQSLSAAGALASPVKFTAIGSETWQSPVRVGLLEIALKFKQPA